AFFAEVKSPDFLVFADFVAGGAGGDRLEGFGLEIVEAFANGVGQAEVLHVGHLIEIERVDVAAIDEAELAALFDGSAGQHHSAGQKQDEDKGNDEQSSHRGRGKERLVSPRTSSV